MWVCMGVCVCMTIYKNLKENKKGIWRVYRQEGGGELCNYIKIIKIKEIIIKVKNKDFLNRVLLLRRPNEEA